MTSLILIIVTVAIGAAAYWFRPQREAAPAQRETAPAAQPTPEPTGSYRPPPLSRKHHFYGATINPGKAPCELAKALLGQRFLTDEAPKLPLAGCSAEKCTCLMLPVDDRRSGFDRRDRLTAYGDFDAELRHEERGAPDRRKSARDALDEA